VEWIGDGAGVCCFGDLLRSELFGGEDEASTDGVEDLLHEDVVRGVEGGEAHSVGMGCDLGGWIHLIAMEEEVIGFGEGDGFAIEEVEGSGVADGGEFGVDERGVDGVGCFADEAEEDGAVGTVAVAGEGERAVEIDGDVRGVREVACCVEGLNEAECCAHGADGVGA
jgi:hypothetical protein